MDMIYAHWKQAKQACWEHTESAPLFLGRRLVNLLGRRHARACRAVAHPGALEGLFLQLEHCCRLRDLGFQTHEVSLHCALRRWHLMAQKLLDVHGSRWHMPRFSVSSL